MATKKKMLQAAAGQAGGAGLDITDVFSTYLYDGTDGTQSIVNGVDLSNEGGLVWVKNRGFTVGGTPGITDSHQLFDTERGVGTRLLSNTTSAALSATNYFSSFNSDGFTVGQNINNGFDGGHRYASWTFRKAPKFFDVVTYTGDGTTDHSHVINHNLGCEIGMVVTKNTSSATYGDWVVDHRSFADVNGGLYLNTTDAQFTNNNIKNLTSTSFSVAFDRNNQLGVQYVAYLFAHNDGDGEFGPDGDQDIIKCGSYTGNGSSQDIDLGFEPQWVIVKSATESRSWYVFDTMRGFKTYSGTDTDATFLQPDTSNAENTFDGISVQSTGIGLHGASAAANNSGQTYIYIAIRRGPLAPPESGTEVFDVDAQNGGSFVNTPFPVDFQINKNRTFASGAVAVSRLTGGRALVTSSTGAEGTVSYFEFDHQNGIEDNYQGIDGCIYWSFKRAPSFFDVVAYTGDGTAGRTVSHNLGVAPEMIWVKSRGAARLWAVYNSASGPTKWLRIDSTNAETTSNIMWNDTSPTDSVFSVGSSTAVNNSGENYIAYLFASLPGISKVGSVSHTNGTDTNVDCGFSSGARFILIKRTDGASSWYVFDTERGIVAGDDKALYLQSTLAEQTADWIDPYSSGFTMVGASFDSGTYIFYAIA